MEHHGDIVPWQMLSKERGVELRYVPVLEDMTSTWRPTRTHCTRPNSCASCTRPACWATNPVERIIEQAHASGARVLLDAAQGAPHTRIDVSELDVDFLAVSAPDARTDRHRQRRSAKRHSADSAVADRRRHDRPGHHRGSTYQDNEHKFEAGTPRIAEAIGWKAAMDYLEWTWTQSTTACSRLRVDGSSPARLPFTVYGRHDDLDSAVVRSSTLRCTRKTWLTCSTQGYAVRTGHHCAQPLLHRLGISSTVRASFYLYNTMEEAEGFVKALEHVLDRFGGSSRLEALQEIIQELAEIEDRMERFEFIFDLAEDVPELPIEAWNDDNRVKGCQSQALEVSLENDRVLLRGADARLVQGLMGLLALEMHDQPLDVARSMTVDHIKEAGVLVAPSRSNGVRTMFDMITQRLEAMSDGE